jgi:ADP-heptose:LPS heptosyltransferase
MAGLVRKIGSIIKNVLWTSIGPMAHTRKHFPLPINFSSALSVLVIRSDRLGDVVLSTPVYASIKKSFPHLRISVLVNHSNTSILSNNPNVDEIIPFDSKNLGTIIKKIRRKRFDVVFTLNKKLSTTASLLALISKTKYRVGYAHNQTSWLYDVRLPVSSVTRHESLNNLELLNYAGITKTITPPCLYFSVDEEDKVDTMLNALRNHHERPLILIKPGVRIAKWGWSLQKFRIVAEKLIKSKKAEVFFIFGPGEESLIDSINKQTNGSIDRIPILPIKEVALVIKKSTLLFCNHTGIMHLASAVRTPVVAIFKHGEIARWGPINTQHILLEERNADTLSPETVLNKIDQLLANNQSD